VWIVNDGKELLPNCHLEIALLDGAGQAVNRFVQDLDVAADSAGIVGRFEWTLPGGGGWRLLCRLEQHGQLVTENEYDLAVHDGLGPGLRQRLWEWLTGLFVPK